MAKTVRMLITTTTTSVWTPATARLPTMLRRLMTTTITTAKNFAQLVLLSVRAPLA